MRPALWISEFGRDLCPATKITIFGQILPAQWLEQWLAQWVAPQQAAHSLAGAAQLFALRLLAVRHFPNPYDSTLPLDCYQAPERQTGFAAGSDFQGLFHVHEAPRQGPGSGKRFQIPLNEHHLQVFFIDAKDDTVDRQRRSDTRRKSAFQAPAQSILWK